MKRRIALILTGVMALSVVAGPASVSATAYEGCTPGYWKQEQHFDSWVGAAPGASFNTTFSVNLFPGKTLLQVLQQGGGGLNAWGRHVVAGYLNALSAVDYDKLPSQVILDVQNVAAGTLSVSFSHMQYEGLNEQYCPLN